MSDERADSAVPLELRKLGQVRPFRRVQQAIVEGALDRVRSSGRRSKVWVAVLLTALGAAVLVVQSWQRPVQVQAPAQPLAFSSDSIPRDFALGPHRIALGRASFASVFNASPMHAEIRLERGEARFAVEPLPQGGWFRVRTSNALVEVVGTRFSVEVKGGCTLVSVQEGRVRVNEALLLPSERTLVCDSEAEATAETLVRTAISLTRDRQLHRARPLFSQYLSAYPAGTFEEESLFYLWVIDASVGTVAEAQGSAEGFLVKFPQGRRADMVRQWVSDQKAHPATETKAETLNP
ncbi:MAG: FecR family protein [Myxococcaceae bacterium]|nr:FecR family protein [Myxococcaceae bacterium]